MGVTMTPKNLFIKASKFSDPDAIFTMLSVKFCLLFNLPATWCSVYN